MIMKYIGDRRGRVLAEGIIQSDREVANYCSAMGISPNSPQVKFFDLRCSREEAARRMHQRPVQEGGMIDRDIDAFAGHFDYITPKLRANGATRVVTDGRGPAEVASELIRAINTA